MYIEQFLDLRDQLMKMRSKTKVLRLYCVILVSVNLLLFDSKSVLMSEPFSHSFN